MILTSILSILIFLTLILFILLKPKFKIGKLELQSFWIVALVGALLMVLTRRIDLSDVTKSLFNKELEMNPIKILVLFFSMTFISIFLEHAGFFKFLASYASSKAKSNQIVLFVILYFLTAVLTIVTSNDIVILTFTPFICYFCKNSKIKPLPYLIAEFAAANTWSMMLIIGNPTNMYLGANAGLTFSSYFRVMALPTLVAGIFEFVLIYLIFRRSLNVKIDAKIETIRIEKKLDVAVGLGALILCIILLAISNFLSLDMWVISLSIALLLLIYLVISSAIRGNFQGNVFGVLKSLPYFLIPFVISMFVIVISLGKNGVSEELGKSLGSNNTIWTYGPASFVASNLINNIPMSILFSTLPTFEGVEFRRAIFSSIIGSNIGAFLTPIGALAGIMFTSLLKSQNVDFTFKDFVKYGVLISLPTFAVALLILSIVL